MPRFHAAVAMLVLVAGCSSGGGGEPAGKGQGPPTTVTQIKTVTVGDKVDLADGDSVRVLDYMANITPSNSFSKPQAGMEFSAIDVEACAGRRRSETGVVNPFDFTLLMSDGTRIQTSIPVKDPGLQVAPLDPGKCSRGFVTYGVPTGAKPAAVVFDASGTSVRWAIR